MWRCFFFSFKLSWWNQPNYIFCRYIKAAIVKQNRPTVRAQTWQKRTCRALAQNPEQIIWGRMLVGAKSSRRLSALKHVFNNGPAYRTFTSYKKILHHETIFSLYIQYVYLERIYFFYRTQFTCISLRRRKQITSLNHPKARLFGS